MTVGENIQTEELKPNEAYRFNFSKDELNEIYHFQRKIVYKRPIRFVLIFGIFIILLFISPSVPESAIGLVFGALLVGGVYHIKNISVYNKTWKFQIERISETDYEYEIFDDYIVVNLYRKNEKVRESKCYFTDIEQIRQFGKWLSFQFGGQVFIVRKSDLKENSALYAFMYNNPSKTMNIGITNKWKIISDVFVFASVFSVFVALILVGAVSGGDHLYAENMWLFFLFTPIPISSVVFGFVLKSKGYKYKKNIIAGIIMTFFLCIYGSFVFMF